MIFFESNNDQAAQYPQSASSTCQGEPLTLLPDSLSFTISKGKLPSMLEEFAFHTRPYSNASVDRATGQGRRISLASKNPFLLALVLSIRHSRNYGVKTRKSHGRGKDPLPESSTKRYFKPRSVRLPYGTIYGNRNVFPFPDGNGNVFPGNVFPFPFQQLMATETSFRFQPTSLP
jgi:hypothetical protein